MGNVADYLHSGGQGRHWRYDFRKVSISGSAIFSYALLLPFMLWLFLWWRQKKGNQINLAFTEIVCLYGYSLAIYIPVSVNRRFSSCVKWKNNINTFTFKIDFLDYSLGLASVDPGDRRSRSVRIGFGVGLVEPVK
jgi:hypothetical protein